MRFSTYALTLQGWEAMDEAMKCSFFLVTSKQACLLPFPFYFPELEAQNWSKAQLWDQAWDGTGSLNPWSPEMPSKPPTHARYSKSCPVSQKPVASERRACAGAEQWRRVWTKKERNIFNPGLWSIQVTAAMPRLNRTVLACHSFN